MSTIPIEIVFAASFVFVIVACEAGYRIGRLATRRAGEKESAVSAITGAVLSLTAFMMAFTFGIVSNRYDSRKALVREEANAIGTAYLRSDLLPEPDRAEAAAMFRRLVSLRLAAADAADAKTLKGIIAESSAIHGRLWKTAVARAGQDAHSAVFALYLSSLNQMIDLQALRVAVAVQARLPLGVWLGLWILVGVGALGIGYQKAVAESRRSMTVALLAFGFALVIAMTASLDGRRSRLIPVSQQPFVDLLASMEADAGIVSRTGAEHR